MITRIWHGWTTLHNASAYEDLLLNEIIPAIERRQMPGFRGISLLRRQIDHEVEFATVMWFDSIDTVKGFAGEHYEVAVVPPKARALLSRFDLMSSHYETLAEPPLPGSAGR